VISRERLALHRARKDGERYHDISIVITVCKPKMITKRIIKRLAIVNVAQSWVNHVNYCVFLYFYVIDHEYSLYAC
jgi:hypothetical protein